MCSSPHRLKYSYSVSTSTGAAGSFSIAVELFVQVVVAIVELFEQLKKQPKFLDLLLLHGEDEGHRLGDRGPRPLPLHSARPRRRDEQRCEQGPRGEPP